MAKRKVCTIIDFDIGAHHEGGVFFKALAACLTPDEKCNVLLRDLFQPYAKRAVIVGGVIADMQRTVLPCHAALCESLKVRIQSLSGKERATCAMVLLQIAENLSEFDLPGLLEELVVSSNGNIRKQVYRRFKARPGLGFPDAVLSSWRRFGDFEAGRLIIDRAPLEVLTNCFPGLERSAASQGWLLARLYLRLKGAAPATLTRLQRLDRITHAYVLTKLGKRLPAAYLVDLDRGRMFDERGGLLVWCAGQMRHWNAVIRMQELRDNPPAHVQVAYQRSLGINPNLELRPVPQPLY